MGQTGVDKPLEMIYAVCHNLPILAPKSFR